jgi:hypothetical protein
MTPTLETLREQFPVASTASLKQRLKVMAMTDKKLLAAATAPNALQSRAQMECIKRGIKWDDVVVFDNKGEEKNLRAAWAKCKE